MPMYFVNPRIRRGLTYVRHTVKIWRITTDEDTESGSNPHGPLHIGWRIDSLFPGFLAAVVLAEPDEVRDLETSMEKGSR